MDLQRQGRILHRHGRASIVIPAQAGIQNREVSKEDARLAALS